MPIPIDNSNSASNPASNLTITRLYSIAPIPSGQLNGTSRTNSQLYELSDAARNGQLSSREKIGPFFLGRELGRGAMGVVHLAVHKQWGTEGAMKLFRIPPKEDSLKRWDGLKMILEELRLLKSLLHPNIVKCYGHLTSKIKAGILLEYAPGGDVFQYLQAHGRFEDAKARQLFAQLISGLSYLHTKGIAHRDLKPENLLLDRAGLDDDSNLIITDFGLACRDPLGKSLDPLMTEQCGTPGFYAPEVVLQKSYRKEADIWSCGIILYAMLTGEYPYKFVGNYDLPRQTNQFYQQVCRTTELSFPPEVADMGVQYLICGMLALEPRRRINLQGIKSDLWLAAHANLLQRSVEDLETIAREQLQKKREASKKQVEEHRRKKELMIQQQQLRQRHPGQQRVGTSAIGKIEPEAFELRPVESAPEAFELRPLGSAPEAELGKRVGGEAQATPAHQPHQGHVAATPGGPLKPPSTPGGPIKPPSWAEWLIEYLTKLFNDGHWFWKKICSIASKIWSWGWH